MHRCNGSFLIPILVCVFLLACCSYYNTVLISPQEISSEETFNLQFYIGPIEHRLRSAQHTKNPERIKEIDPVIYEHMGYKLHPDSEYFCLWIHFVEKEHLDTNFIIRADSVYFKKDSLSELNQFIGWEQDEEREGPHARRLGIMPFAIAKGYRGRFEIQFVLKVLDLRDSRILRRIPIGLDCRNERKLDLGGR